MNRRPREEILFNDGRLGDYLNNHRDSLLVAIARIPDDQLLGTPIDDLVEMTTRPHLCQAIELYRDQITTSEHETMISIEDIPDGRYLYHEDNNEVPGHCYKFHVPFAGDPSLWKLQGSQILSSPPYAQVNQSELVFAYSVASHEPVLDLKQRFEQEVGRTAALVQNSAKIVAAFNANLPNEARAAIDHRRAQLLRARQTVAAFGYPLRQREGVQPVPLVRKPLTIPRSSNASPTSFKPEPAIDEAQYESILQIISNMSLVFERNPSAFRKANEETIRTHFLVHLNGIFEGNATGETFNAAGKTDILIRVDNKNVFIAECKFWTGPKGFGDAIDQLISYASWRDTKTALLIFNRETQMSTVTNQISSLLAAHSQFKRAIPQGSETQFRAMLRKPNDPNRELWLTVMVFDVPG